MKLILYLNKTIEYSFYLLFFLVPLYFTNNTSELFELNKMWLTWWIALIIMGAWISKMIAQKRFVIQRTPLDILLLLFLLSQFLSTIFSFDMHISLWGYYSRFNGGFLSILTYILLYYAFVTNYHDIAQDQENKPARFSFPVRLSLFAGGLLIFPIAIAISAPPPGNPDATNTGLLLVSMVISFFCFIFSLPYSFLRRILFISLISGLIVALWGIPSHFGKDPTCLLFRGEFNVSCWTEAFYPTVRTFSTLGQPAWLAAYVSVLLPIATAYFLLREKNRKDSEESIIQSFSHLLSYKAAAFGGLMILFYLSLLFANTKGGFIGFWIGSGIFWAVLFLKRFFSLKVFLQVFILINSIFFFLNFVFGTPVQQLNALTLSHLTPKSTPSSSPAPSTTQNATPAPSPAGELGGTDSGQIRLYVWNGALDIWKAYPVFGTGVETFAFAYYKFRPAGHNLTSEWDYLYNKAHNEYLNYLATTGAFGLGTYLLFIAGFYFVVLRNSFNGVKRMLPSMLKKEPTKETDASSSPSSQMVVFGLVAGFTTILVSNFFGFSVVIINLYLLLIPAFVLGLLHLLNPEKSFAFPKKDPEVVQVSGGQWVGITTVVLVALYLSFMLFLFRKADIAYALGNNLDNVQEYQQAYPLLQEAVTTRPGEPVFKDEFALNSATLATLMLLQEGASNSAEMQQQASQLAQQAIQLHNEVITKHPNNIVFWKNRVRIFYLLSQVDTQYLPYAVDAMKQVSILAPTDAKVMYNLGVLYRSTNNLPEAEIALKRAIALKPNYRDPYYALALTLHEKSQGDQKIEDEAKNSLRYILEHISPDDKEAEELLKSWNGL